MPSPVDVHVLGQVEYEPTWLSMQSYSQERGPDATDQIWLLQHPPVFTQGQAGRAEHLLQPGDIPVVQVDRGGQVTYHGPGQLVAYVLFDIRRMKTDVRRLVTALEQSVVDVLAHYGVAAAPRKDAPGVYVGADKICSLGLRIKRGCSYHGLALNLDMDMEPFQRINPCGYQGLRMTQLADFGHHPSLDAVQRRWVEAVCQQLSLEPHWQTRQQAV